MDTWRNPLAFFYKGHGLFYAPKGTQDRRLNPIRSRLFLPFKPPPPPLTIYGTIQAIPMNLCTAVILLNSYQNTLRKFLKSGI